MFAKLGWWIVVACRWLVKACFSSVLFDRFGLKWCALCVQCWACGCTCLQRLVGGLLLLVCGLSKLA